MVFGANRRDKQVCDGKLRNVILEERRLAAAAASGNAKATAQLAAQRKWLAGERAQCLSRQTQRRKTFEAQARAERGQAKTQREMQRQEAAQARLATKMQRLEYRRARREAGMEFPASTALAAGGVAAAVAAALFLF